MPSQPPVSPPESEPVDRDEPRPRARRTWIALAAFGAALAIALSWAGVRARSYVRHDERFCTSCHTPKDAGVSWHAKGHKDLECRTCHSAGDREYGLLWKKLTHGTPLPKHGAVASAQCASCHQSRPDWTEIAATEGHRQHANVKDTDCLSCHVGTTHKDAAPTEATCLQCHDSLRLHAKSSGPETETCLSCHGFVNAPRSAQKPVAQICRACHADAAAMAKSPPAARAGSMTVFDDQTVHGGLNCKLCHDPHGKKLVAEPLSEANCVRCHQLELLKFSADQSPTATHRKCSGCHQPHAARALVLESCLKCHEKVLTGGSADKPLGKNESTALAHKSCATCHKPHTWKPPADGCIACHEQATKLVKTQSPKAHGDCKGCHHVHGPKPSGAVCVDCHQKQSKTHLALAPAKHKDCVSCHAPHAPSPAEARNACVKCHDTQLASATKGPKGHAKEGCRSCHTPHDDPKPREGACGKCHAAASRLVATAETAEHRDCASCHRPHAFAVTDVKETCLSCHGRTPEGKTPRAPKAAVIDPAGTHKGKCNGCHAQHGPKNVAQTNCLECHKTVQAAFASINPTHGACKSCHTPHQAAGSAKGKCVTCHDKNASAAAKWPATSAHAGPCIGCHQQHDAKKTKSCAECHEAQAKSAKGGKHACAQCHAPHKEPSVGAAWWGRCASCHAKEVAAAKDRGPKHSVCKSCHAPHAFTPPTCTSCHTDVQRKGLHTKPQHTKCAACHDTHGKAMPAREQCVACHVKSTTHQPAAKTCQGCHVFR